jgi:hypothetical protein
VRTHYDLLGIQAAADADEVKRAFRREIARYHPDKVQHLGTEFQEIAATRAAALTEAYRVLMDVELRQRYDDGLADRPGDTPHAAPGAAQRTATAPAPPPSTEPAPPPAADPRVSKAEIGTTAFVRRAVTARLTAVVTAAGGTTTTAPGFDLAFHIEGRKALFRQAEPALRLAVRLVSHVDSAAVAAAWGPAVRLVVRDETLCLMLLGSGMAPSRELALAVSDLRKKSQRSGPVVIPVDVRDWAALIPPETPGVVRTMLDRLRLGD